MKMNSNTRAAWLILLMIPIILIGSFILFVHLNNQRNEKSRQIEQANTVTAQKILANPIEKWPELLIGQNIGVLDKMGIQFTGVNDSNGYIYNKDKNFWFVRIMYPANADEIMIYEINWVNLTPKI